MKVKIWGARGSVPSPLKPDAIREKIYQAIIGLGSEVDSTNPDSVRAYVNALPPLVGGTSGGNTACVQVQVGDETCIIDAGSGIRELGLELMNGPCGQGRGRLHLFFSHAHWDHIQGFPFFRPAFVPGNQIFIYSIHPFDWREAVLSPQQSQPFFPIDLDYLKANIEFSRIEPEKSIFIGPAKITHKRLNHPGVSYAYRFDEGASSFVYASDAEYKIAMGEASINPYVEFFAGADVLIFDSQLTFKEATEEKLDWGHSTALIGVDLARRAGVKTLVLYHHDPNDTDADLLQAKADALEYQAQTPSFPPVDIEVAYEGLAFDLVATTTITLNRLPEDDVAILTLAPTLDERQVGELQEELVRLKAAGWPSRLIIDFSHVESLAVVGLNPFITLRREHSDTLIALVGLSERVYRVIKLAGFLDFFKIFDSIDEVLSVPQTPDPTGQLVNGRYQIEDKIGESWLGAVYRATDTQEQTRIAVKILSSSFSEQAIDQFLNQAREILKLDHPNIVNVIDCNQDQHGAYIAQELMDGQTLRDLFSANRRLPVEQAIVIALNIARALEYAHGRGVIHGDLRPKNIFLTGDLNLATPSSSVGPVKLTDFGLGRLREGKNLLNEVLVLHVAYYLAPEQIEGKPLDARTDLYALGVLLYEMVTGQLPFAGLDQVVMRAHLYDNPVPPRRLNPELSRPLDHFILKLLSKSPDDRYATAHQAQRVLSNLSHYGERQAIRSPALSHPQQHLMIGRQEPLREILDCWEAACKGQGQLVLIAGETGIGKTRLTEEVANLIPTGTLLVGHCHAVEGSLAYQPFIEALRAYFGSVPPNTTDEHVGRLLSNVVRWVPEIRAILPSLPEAPPLEPKQEQLRLMNSLARYIERATQEQPWLLILDDLHWADQSSLQLLHYLARHCGSMALLIIGTYRDTDLLEYHPLLDTLHDLQRSPGYKHYVLDRLTEDEVGQMLAAMWAQRIPDWLTRKIYEVTEGNPFYVEEVVKGMMDDGTAARLDGAWVFSSAVEVRLPKSVRDAVLRRITYLRQDTQKLLRQAAVLGRTFNFDDLQQMSGLSEWELLERLDEALERQLVEEAPAETMLRFRHAEIQHVLYHELGNIRRRLLHRQAGDALEMRHLSDPRHMVEELAHHFEEAGESEKALIYSIQAARHADGAYASQTALQWYNRALVMLDRLELDASTHNQRYELLLALERLYGRQGMRDKQLANLRQALTVANNLNDLAKQAHVHNQLCFYYRMVSDYAAARTHAELGLEAARQAKAPVLEGESLSNLAYVEQDQGQYQSALEHMEDAQAILEATNDRRLEAISLKGLGLLHLKLNNYEKARLYFEQALALNRSLGNRRGESDCLNNLGEIERERGNYAAASACYEQTLGIDRAIGNRYGEAIALLNLALTYLALGSYQKAHEFVEEAVQINQSIDDQLGRAEALNIQSDIHYALEAYESARDDAKEALATFQKLATPMTIATAQLSLGLALEALHDHAPAVEAFEQAAAQWRDLGDEANALDAQAGLARCCLAAGEVDRALEIVEESLTWLHTHSLTGLDHPFRFYQTAYTVLQQAGHTERAITVLTEAHDLLQTRATTIADEALRQSYLDNVPQNRAIVQAWREISTSS